ncbi:hypothetical protein [Longimicrobium sp.]|uniref:hypothetical protein n=1 Tax=Longimicrobium sp. TaxID=2029185 RepID=UPI003B3AFC1E
MNRVLPLLCAALLGVGACKDGGTPTVPKENADLVVHLSVGASPATVETGPQAQQLISCTFTLFALASGDLAARADWTGGMVRMFTGFDTQAVDSMSLSSSDLTEVFGGPFSPLLDGVALLEATASAPFSIVAEVSYRVQNTDARRVATSAPATCAPSPVASRTGRVSAFSVSPPRAAPSRRGGRLH